MGPIQHIRRSVLRITQTELAAIAGVTQATVSRWENDELEPNREEMSRIRQAARERGVLWDDRWFFEVPTPAQDSAA